MSYNFSFTAPDKQAAKDELASRNRNEAGGDMPAPVEAAVGALVDAMNGAPAGYVFNVSAYGHSDPNGAEPRPENHTVSIMHVIA